MEKVKNSDKAGTESQKEQLAKFIKNTTRAASQSLLTGVFLALAGAAVLFIPLISEPAYISHSILFVGPNSGKIIIAVLVEFAAIALLTGYKSSIKQANDYRTELIALRDLNIALEICDNTSEEDFENTETMDGTRKVIRHRSQKSKMEQSVIEAPLNRYE